MDYVSIALAGAAGLTVGGFIIGLLNRKLRQAQAALIEEQRDYIVKLEADCRDHWGARKALRRNCFVTNEKGHRVRYFDASPEKRAAAEQ